MGKNYKKLDTNALFKDSEDNKIELVKMNIQVNDILLSIPGFSYLQQVDFLEQQEFLKSFVGGYKTDIKLIIHKKDERKDG